MDRLGNVCGSLVVTLPSSATHCHTSFAPAQCEASLIKNIAESVRLATADLQPSTASASVGHEDSIVFNRRFLMKDGTVLTNPGSDNLGIVSPVGPTDPDVNVVYFETPTGAPLVTLVNYALHLATVGENLEEISADYPYTLAKLLGEVKGKEMLTIFTIGTAGNINHLDVKRPGRQSGHDKAARIGTILAASVLKTFPKLQRIELSPPRVLREMVKLPLPQVKSGDVEKARAIESSLGTKDPPEFLDQVWAQRILSTAARNGKPLEAEVQVITVGDDLAWVGLPGEIFVELGMAIKRSSPFRFTIINEVGE
jgi:neutral ceramidase